MRSKPSREEINNSLNLKANNDDIFQVINNLSQELINRPTNEEIYKTINEKMNKNELIYYLNQKPNIEEINSLLNEKISLREYKNNYNDLLNKFDLFKNEIFNKINNISNTFVKKNDIINIQNELDNKANIVDVENALDTKEDKDKVFFLLNNKLDKNEIDKLNGNKIDKKDFIVINKKLDEKLDKLYFEQFLEEYHNNNKNNSDNIIENINNKVEKKDFKLFNDSYLENKQIMSKKIEDIDNDLDRLIESVKEQFQSLNIVINNLEHNKIDKNEFDMEKLKNIDDILKNKIEHKDIEIIINKTKNNLMDAINNFKNGENANMKIFEENIQNKIDKIIFDNQSMLNDLTNTNQNINNYFTQKQAEMENLMSRMRLLLNNNDIYNNNNNISSNFNNNNNIIEERIKNEVQNIIENNNNKLNQKFREKLDISKFEEFLNGLKEDLDNKINLFTMKKANEDVINEVNNKIRELYRDINTEIQNKVSKNEIESILSNKLDNNNFLNNNNISNNLNDKLSKNDFKDYIDNISLELKQKLDINKFNSIISTFNSNFENIHKDMNSKADIKNILELLKQKTDNDNFNKIINNIQKEITTKVNSTDFSNAMDNQAIINDTLCNENNIGRWLWKSGKVKNNLSVPWEVQIINTSPDNFIWEKDKPFININEGGLYEINIGFYADKKPMIQIMVNGEVIISAINSNSFVIHQSPGGRMKGTGKTSFGNVTGLTMIDFIILPDKAKINISYTGEEGIGFLGLKKL